MVRNSPGPGASASSSEKWCCQATPLRNVREGFLTVEVCLKLGDNDRQLDKKRTR